MKGGLVGELDRWARDGDYTPGEFADKPQEPQETVKEYIMRTYHDKPHSPTQAEKEEFFCDGCSPEPCCKTRTKLTQTLTDIGLSPKQFLRDCPEPCRKQMRPDVEGIKTEFNRLQFSGGCVVRCGNCGDAGICNRIKELCDYIEYLEGRK